MDYLFHTPYNKAKNSRRLTVAGTFNETTNQLSIGISVCAPNDQFERKRGTAIAKGRSMSKNPFSTIELTEKPTNGEFVALAEGISREQLKAMASRD